MTKLTSLALIPLAAFAGRSCSPTHTATKPPSKPAVVVIWDDEDQVPNVSPPQRLDVLFEAKDVDRCEAMGGELVFLKTPRWDFRHEAASRWDCEGVDY